MNPPIFTSLPGGSPSAPLHSHGKGEMQRHVLTQTVHAGIKAAMDRPVQLILNNEETLRLAVSLINVLPLDWLAQQTKEVERLGKVVAMLKTYEHHRSKESDG